MSTATTNSKSKGGSNDKKMQYKRVSYDVNEIAPDAPEAEWKMAIPRGKAKVQPTKEEQLPMLVIPIRLEATDEEGDKFEKAVGTELSIFIVFFGEDNPRAAKLSKLRLRSLCEATDVDLDLIPKELDDPETQLQPLIRALEGKKFTGWTVHQVRRDTGEVVTEIRFTNPTKVLTKGGDDEDEDDDNDSDSSSSDDDSGSTPKKKRKAPAKKTTSKRS